MLILKRLPYKQLVLFGVAGIFGYLADVCITLLLIPYTDEYIARIPAFLGAASVTWVINRKTTFSKNESTHASLFSEYTHYLYLMIFGLIANYVTYAIVVTIMADSGYKIPLAIALGSISGMLINFFTVKRFIYRTR